jgi:metal-responsive CopG/Arc/MetJ family transcriptional regulator
MKKMVSISISTNILKEVDRTNTSGCSRSAFIEKVLWAHFRSEIGTADMLLVNANAEEMNREMEDVLRYRADVNEPLPE